MIDAVIGAVLAFTVPEICVYFAKYLSEEEKIQCYVILTILSLMILVIYNFSFKNMTEESYQRQLFQVVSVVMTSVMIKFVYPLLFVSSQPPVAGSLIAIVLIATLFLPGKWKDMKMILQQGMTLFIGGVYFLMKFEEYLNPILKIQPYLILKSMFILEDTFFKIIAKSFREFLYGSILFFFILCEPVNYVYGFDTICLHNFDLRVIVCCFMLTFLGGFLYEIQKRPQIRPIFMTYFFVISLTNYVWIILDDLILVNYFHHEYQLIIRFFMKGLNICQYYFLYKSYEEKAATSKKQEEEEINSSC